ncbi:MAG: sortase [Hyphomonadaceae bacterium]|nr:sortase [Hyphomonadaceae bacterium]
MPNEYPSAICSFLKDLRTGDLITVSDANDRTHSFQMTSAEIVHKNQSGFLLQQAGRQLSQIALVTYYPFDSMDFGGPMRYIVHAQLLNSKTGV